MRPLDLLAMLHLARPTLPPFLSPLVNPRRTSSSTALNAFCPIFGFPLPSRLSLVWLSSSCYTPLGFLTLSVSWNYWKRAKKKKKKKNEKRKEIRTRKRRTGRSGRKKTKEFRLFFTAGRRVFSVRQKQFRVHVRSRYSDPWRLWCVFFCFFRGRLLVTLFFLVCCCC